VSVFGSTEGGLSLTEITLSLHPAVGISAEEAGALAGWLGKMGTSAAESARRYLLAAAPLVDDDPQLALSDVERAAIREALANVDDLASLPGLLKAREWLSVS
jgi:hypothetical protein